MTVLIQSRNAAGGMRRCDGKCHGADPGAADKCGCICGGQFHGRDPDTIPLEEVSALRKQVELREGEHVQLRIGA